MTSKYFPWLIAISLGYIFRSAGRKDTQRMSVCVQLRPIQWCTLRTLHQDPPCLSFDWSHPLPSTSALILHCHSFWDRVLGSPLFPGPCSLYRTSSEVTVHTAYCVVEKRQSLLCYQVKFLQGMRLDHDQRDHYQERHSQQVNIDNGRKDQCASLHAW